MCIRDRFKYISCSYLSKSTFALLSTNCIQIHLMFLFINDAIRMIGEENLFKYISCSYLSRLALNLFILKIRIQIHLMFLFIQRFSALSLNHYIPNPSIFQGFLTFLPAVLPYFQLSSPLFIFPLISAISKHFSKKSPGKILFLKHTFPLYY